MPRFVKQQDFAMYHDITDGVSAGWTVAFNVHYLRTRPPSVTMWATSPTGRTIRGPIQVSRIMPMEDWPQFAIDAASKQADSNTDERLF